MNELCVFPRPFVCARAASRTPAPATTLLPMPRSPPDAIAATAPLRRRPKNLKLKLGDYLEYTPATGEPKNGAPGKPRATKVERAPRPKKPSKKQLEDAAEAARVAALAAAALERRNAPPVSKLEALALRVEERRSTSESAEVDEAEERPDRLRSRLRLKARSASEPEQPFSDVSKLAKGPDGTTGFLRARTIKPFGFSAEVAEFVPSFLPAASEPPNSY